MGEPLQISAQQLRAAFDAILTRLTEQHGESITLERDYFWSIPPSELYNVYEQPHQLTIGQLSESWQNIQQLLEDDTAAIPHHLIWLADILRAFGHSETRKPLTQ